MDKPETYCDAVLYFDESDVNRIYHDSVYGFPVTDDNQLFERLVLEINQAGLSWTTILNKQDNFRKAYHNFNIQKVASYGETERQRLLNDASIIRNRLKIDAAIHNAGIILKLQEEYGSFKNWLDKHHPMTKQEWTGLFKRTFRFTGGEIVNEFLISTGYLKGAHIEKCPRFKEVLESGPAWLI